MSSNKFSGNQIRQTFVDFFVERGHTFVPSSSLVPGGDQTLLFANSGMVQFKDVFLGTEQRPYTRAVNSQKSMRVSGKHNDLEDVGQDDTHHTFFEMLGNWSFGDYYKKEAIAWAWELFTGVWGLEKDRFWATCFEDELGEIPRDDEAAGYWRAQDGFNPDQLLFFGRKDNFWEMAETGPCGPNSEIHYDRGPSYCNMQGVEGHVCAVNGDCGRYLELWNLVFIQYNRLDPKTLEPLPKKHVDTGMGFERIVSVLQDVPSNYLTDLLSPLMDLVQEMTGDQDEARERHLTPYRVIADHGRAAAFLIADGVVPGNTGRNYVCRMIIRRAARFGGKIGLNEPFLARVAEVVIQQYGGAYPELVRNRTGILETITREEQRFRQTLESGVANLQTALDRIEAEGKQELPGSQAFDLYATYGLPLEITRDIARERGLDVDNRGFENSMEIHRLASGAGRAYEGTDGEAAGRYQAAVEELQAEGSLPGEGVAYDPYDGLAAEGRVLALFKDGEDAGAAAPGDTVEVLLPQTVFYLEAGGQVSDTGTIRSSGQDVWKIDVQEIRRPTAGAIVHRGVVAHGSPRVGDMAIAEVDSARRRDIMRNHTATHLLHAALHAVLGDHARQAGSLVAPDRLRFDFTHAEAVGPEQLAQIEARVNQDILADHTLRIAYKPLQQAIEEGAIALFGEKYAETVRTISIGDDETFSYELCGGTHLKSTADVGVFLITAEGSVASGIRRIEAVTGREAYHLIRKRFEALSQVAKVLGTSPELAAEKTALAVRGLAEARKDSEALRTKLAGYAFEEHLTDPPMIAGIPVLAATLPHADNEALRQMADRFRQRYPSGVAVLASVSNGRPMVVAAVTEDLVPRGLHAGELVNALAEYIGGGGGGRPTLAQAGGKDSARLEEAIASVAGWVEKKLQP